MNPGALVLSDTFSYTGTSLTSSTSNQFLVRYSGGIRFFADPETYTGVELHPGGNAWSPTSDRNLKENFAAVDYREFLSRLDKVPVTTWNLKSQSAAIRHIGAMAQDFQAAFRVGEDDRHISTSDADGVALAAIKGIHELLKEKDAQIEKLEKRLAALEQLLKNRPADK
jgi:hypothetical protein